MKKRLFKTIAVAAVFALSYVGVSYSTSTEKIGDVELSTTLVSLGSQATASCTEQWEGGGLGTCNEFGRCAYSGGWGNCTH